MEYQFDKWKRQDWHKGSRHYCCEVKQNLFGQWIVLRRWGRVSAMRGQCIEVVCDRYEQGIKIFNAVARRREKRGYSAW